VRRRLLVLVIIAIAVVAFQIATRPPTLSPREDTLAHWTFDRLRAWVAVRPSPTPGPASASATPKPTPTPPSVGRPRTPGDAVSRASGRIFLAFGFDDGTCSGTVITDRSRDVSLVLTAGHCVYELERSRFASAWLFVPGLALGEIPDCVARPTGCWTPRALLIEQAFVSAGTFNDEAVTHDIGIAVIDAGPAHDQLDQVAGNLPLADAPAAGDPVELVGYPGDRQDSGSGLTTCSGVLDEVPATSSSLVWAAACDMTGGSSGGAWLVDTSAGTPSIVSVTSAGVRDESRFGPVFDADTMALIDAAETATSNTVLAR